MAKLVKVRLSENPATKTAEYADGLNGKVSVSSGGKNFVILEFVDDKNIFKHSRAVRTYWMNGDKWAGASPSALAQFEGKDVPGKFVTMPVAPYEIKNDDNTVNTASTYTTFVMPHENPAVIIAKQGHTVLNEDGTVLLEAIGQRMETIS
jgi:hypothetical protein